MSLETNSAGILLRNRQRRYLIVHENPKTAYGSWTLPAGWADSEEMARQAAIQEARDALGLEAELIRPEPVYREKTAPDGNFFIFLGRLVGGELRFDPERIDAAEWLAAGTIRGLSNAGKVRDIRIMAAVNQAEAI